MVLVDGGDGGFSGGKIYGGDGSDGGDGGRDERSIYVYYQKMIEANPRNSLLFSNLCQVLERGVDDGYEILTSLSLVFI